MAPASYGANTRMNDRTDHTQERQLVERLRTYYVWLPDVQALFGEAADVLDRTLDRLTTSQAEVKALNDLFAANEITLTEQEAEQIGHVEEERT